MATFHIQLHNVNLETLQPGDEIECTINGDPHEARYVGPASWERCIWVELPGLRETAKGKIVPDLFESFRDEFTICSGKAWNGYAGMVLESDEGKGSDE